MNRDLKPMFKKFVNRITSEINSAVSQVNSQDAEKISRMVQGAKRIFVCGEGRSGLIMHTFAMRLMQLGLNSSVVGETTTPSISEKDLLLACSGSGETLTTVIYAKKAKEQGASIIGITTSAQSSLGKLSDQLLIISAPKKGDSIDSEKSIQLSGSLFEQTVFLVLETLVMVLQKKLKIKTQDLMKRHANLE